MLLANREMAVQLQPYKFDIAYHPGASNPADYLSRHPQLRQKRERKEKDEGAVEFVKMVVHEACPSAYADRNPGSNGG